MSLYNTDKDKHLTSTLGCEQKDTESHKCEVEMLLQMI